MACGKSAMLKIELSNLILTRCCQIAFKYCILAPHLLFWASCNILLAPSLINSNNSLDKTFDKH